MCMRILHLLTIAEAVSCANSNGPTAAQDVRIELMLTCPGAGILIAVPIMVGFIVSRIFAEPFYEVAQRYNSQVFALSDREKIEGAKEV